LPNLQRTKDHYASCPLQNIGFLEGAHPIAAEIRPTGSGTPDSGCFVEDKRPLCQLSSKRLEDNWHGGFLSSTEPAPHVAGQHTSKQGLLKRRTLISLAATEGGLWFCQLVLNLARCTATRRLAHTRTHTHTHAHTHTRTHAHAHTHTRTHTQTHARPPARTRTHVNTHTAARAHRQTHAHTHARHARTHHKYMPAYVYIYMYMYVYAYVYMCIYVCIYLSIYMCGCMCGCAYPFLFLYLHTHYIYVTRASPVLASRVRSPRCEWTAALPAIFCIYHTHASDKASTHVTAVADRTRIPPS